MSPKDWITMGNELRAELDALEERLAVLVVNRLLPEEGPHVKACWDAADEIVQRYVCVLTDREESVLRTVRGRSRDEVRAEYRDGFVKLRSHGRALDWPEKPWSAA